jgi:GT2 family glycosyltransferase
MLDGCLTAICASVRACDEVIVVDSASRSPTVKTVAGDHGVSYVRCDLPGASRARNAGWRAGKHDYVAFVDDDVRVAGGWADALRHALDTYPEVTFVTGRLGLLPGQEDAARPVALKDEDTPIMRSTGLLHDLGHSANLAVRRSALEAIGGFDEQLGPGGYFRNAEDRDLFDRLQSAGGTGRYEPTAAGWHDQWRSPTQLVALDFDYGFGAGARVTKLLRTDLVKGMRAAKDLLWGWGLLDAYRHGKKGDAGLLLAALIRLVGSTLGMTRALFVRIEAGHFTPHVASRRSVRG